MKFFVAFLSLLFASVGVYAQDIPAAAPQSPPDFQVIKYSWSKERISWENDPFSGTAGFGNDVRDRARRDRRPASVLREREAKEEQAEKEKPAEPPRYAFRYKVSVHNTGSKAIREIDWDYIFTDSVTGEELGRREFTSVEKVSPGKRKELIVSASSPPTKKISVYTLGKNEHDGLTEQIVVLRILYEDGTVWQPR